MPLRVLITGCRSWKATDIARDVVSRLVDKHGHDILIVHGACPTGVDAAFDAAATEAGLPVERHPVDWDGPNGKASGPIRNAMMVDLGADFAIAVHRSLAWSKGTGNCVRLCLAAGIPVYLIDGTNPTRRIREVPKREGARA